MSDRLPTIPRSTYRLQFTPHFGFRDAEAVVSYLHDLGIGTLYASPYLRARSGSMHGYDIIDHNALNPEVGTVDEHAAMIAALHAAEMTHVLDFVPNHMGIGPDNPWWRDVLEWGERSRYASYFDIDWHPLKAELRGKVLAPTLGDQFGRVLENGDLRIAFIAASGELVVRYFETAFPLAPPTYAPILRRAAADGAPALAALADAFAALDGAPSLDEAGRAQLAAEGAAAKTRLAAAASDAAIAAALDRAIATYAVTPDDPRRADALDGLLALQHYRLAYWRVAVDEINYRRFFDVNDLAGLRVEDANVLGQTHRFVFEMIADGKIQGLRIDHVDGLYNPGGYCNFLQERAATLGQPLYVVVEKILAPFERLRTSWSIAGTTGYEFMALVNGLFVDPRAEASFDRIYDRFTGTRNDYESVVSDAKHRIMTVNLASELTVLATELARIAGSDRRSSDFTYNGLRGALGEIVAAFPVYRTYVVSEEIEEDDEAFIAAAIGVASDRSSALDKSVFGFISDVLTLRAAGGHANYDRNHVLRFAMRFQQYTSPVMAKSVEDTAFYRYVRLVSLNEVGGEPRRFGTTLEQFHAANLERAQTRPHTMLATATHDHKRGEDVRTRIDALSEFPAEWSRALKRWARLNRGKRTDVRGVPAPSPNDEYLLYQTLIGTWPTAWRVPAEIDDDAYATYVERISAYMQKAQREAKLRTSWASPDEDYETATALFVASILERGAEARFPGEIATFVGTIAPGAMIASLAQVVLKATAPGVPDFYQGTELWDHSLVDPDNRRAVDYDLRAAMLREIVADPAAARASWDDGRVKLFTVWQTLQLRAAEPSLFLDGGYEALTTSGPLGDRVVAFARESVIVIVPRLVGALASLEDGVPRIRFGDERLTLPQRRAKRYRERFTGELVEANDDGTLAFGPQLERFPVAILEPEAAG